MRDLSAPEVNTGSPSGGGFGLCNAATWNETIDIVFQTGPDGPFGWQIFWGADRCLYVATTFAHSELFGIEDGSTWSEIKSLPSLISALACPPVGLFCILAGDLKNEVVLDVLQAG